MRHAAVFALVLALLAGALPGRAAAHEVRSALLSMIEDEPGRFDTLWRVPARGERIAPLTLAMPAGCRPATPPLARLDGTRMETAQRFDCPRGLAGTEIGVRGLERFGGDVLVRLTYANGGTETHRLDARAPMAILEGERRLGQVAAAYFLLGVEHILLGVDHLLFVAALMMIVVGWRVLLATLTAFTLAHSVTLGLSTLGHVSLPGPLVEALIALSIVVVAAEALGAARGECMARRALPPWSIAFAFGLLHGFGFAGALGEIGLPTEAVPAALLFFNLGVEAGQILFVAAVLGLGAAWRAFRSRPLPAGRIAAIYAIGIVAAYWTVERVTAIWI